MLVCGCAAAVNTAIIVIDDYKAFILQDLSECTVAFPSATVLGCIVGPCAIWRLDAPAAMGGAGCTFLSFCFLPTCLACLSCWRLRKLKHARIALGEMQ